MISFAILFIQVDERDGGGIYEIFPQDESHSRKGCDGEGNPSLIEGVEVEGCQQEETVVNEATPGEPFLRASLLFTFSLII